MHLLLFFFKHMYCDLANNKIFNAVCKINEMIKALRRKKVLFCYLCAVRRVLFMSAQCYLCAYSAFLYVQCLYFEPFSLNIFNNRPFMSQIGSFLTYVYMFYILIEHILALYIQYGLVQAKIVEAKTFQKLFC